MHNKQNDPVVHVLQGSLQTTQVPLDSDKGAIHLVQVVAAPEHSKQALLHFLQAFESTKYPLAQTVQTVGEVHVKQLREQDGHEPESKTYPPAQLVIVV